MAMASPRSPEAAGPRCTDERKDGVFLFDLGGPQGGPTTKIQRQRRGWVGCGIFETNATKLVKPSGLEPKW